MTTASTQKTARSTLSSAARPAAAFAVIFPSPGCGPLLRRLRRLRDDAIDELGAGALLDLLDHRCGGLAHLLAHLRRHLVELHLLADLVECLAIGLDRELALV